MIRKTKTYLLILLFFVTACSSIPKNTQNSCAIFEERYLWYKHSKAAYEKYKPRGFRPFPSRRSQEGRMAGQSFGDFFGRREQNIAQTDI